MCGIAGYLTTNRSWSDAELQGRARGMSDCIPHRGPDDWATWADASAGVAMAHRRLAIVDLSPQGRQPMQSASGRFVMVFNGEIYNYERLREELGRQEWRGHSDTEVALAAFERWGVRGAVERFNGMFAIALWDRETRALSLMRDRIGEKPLYYGWLGTSFAFASELKALRSHPEFSNEIDRGALALYMRHNCIPAPYSIFKGIRKLLPGTLLSLRASDSGRPEPSLAPFWSATGAAVEAAKNPFTGSPREALDALDPLLREAVAMRMQADVPLGAFLSGGIDSSLIVGMMQAESDRPVRTFSIGFGDDAYDEAKYAKAVAAHLGTTHTEMYVTAGEALDAIPRMPVIYDEPFSDPSQIPTYLVSRMARRHVTVALSGDGGDELFGGYNRYVWGRRVWGALGWTPVQLRRGVASALRARSPAQWNTLAARVSPLLPHRLRITHPGEQAHKLAGVIAAPSPAAMHLGLASHWPDPAALVPGSVEPPTQFTSGNAWPHMPGLDGVVQRMMHLDLVTFLPDDILVKVDRASMAVSLEARVPFLDHRVVEFAMALPMSMKVQGGEGKWIIRQLLDRYVPRPLVERPKAGFRPPIEEWLRGPLRDWAESLLDEERLRREGYFDPAPIRRRWEEHLSGSTNWAYSLWDVLMFQAWLETA